MNIYEIIQKLKKRSFTMPGISKETLITLEDVVEVLYEESGMPRLVSEQEERLKKKVYDEEIADEITEEGQSILKEFTDELPPEILANLETLQSGIMEKRPEDSRPTPEGTAPVRPSGG